MNDWKINSMDSQSIPEDVEMSVETTETLPAEQMNYVELYVPELPPGTSLEEVIRASIPRYDDPLLDRQPVDPLLDNQPIEPLRTQSDDPVMSRRPEDRLMARRSDDPLQEGRPVEAQRDGRSVDRYRRSSDAPRDRESEGVVIQEITQAEEKSINRSKLKRPRKTKAAKSRGKTSDGRRKRRNPFITFFLSMYSRRPRKRAADVARQAGRQWGRMSDRQRMKYVTLSAVEDWRRDQAERQM